jgi:hypothetical protein
VWLYGIAVLLFLFGLLGGVGGGNTNSVYDRVYAPLPEGQSVRGEILSPFAWFTIVAAAIVWLAPFAAALLAWQGRKAKQDNPDPGTLDRLAYGTAASLAILGSYLTPVGWTLVYGLTRWSMMNIWGEGPDAANLGRF